MRDTTVNSKRILVGVTGASGAPYAVAFLRRQLGDVYLALSNWGRMVMREETGLQEDDLRPLVQKVFSDKDLANPFSSGFFDNHGQDRFWDWRHVDYALRYGCPQRAA